MSLNDRQERPCADNPADYPDLPLVERLYGMSGMIDRQAWKAGYRFDFANPERRA